MNHTNAASLISSLLMLLTACAACVQVDALEEPANPNVAPQAAVTADSENFVRRKYFAQCAVDGKTPVENQAFADDAQEVTETRDFWLPNSHEFGCVACTCRSKFGTILGAP